MLPALMMGFASSCMKDNTSEYTETDNCLALSILTSLEDGSVYVSQGYYVFDIKLTDSESTGTVKSPNLLANNSIIDFTTATQSYMSTGRDIFFKDALGMANNGKDINSANFYATSYLLENGTYGYYYNLGNAGKYTLLPAGLAPFICVAKYNIGDSYRVNTFQTNTFFQGTTTTSYNYKGEQATYTTEDITYRFILDMEKNSATMVIYNAKFSNTPEPVKEAIIVEGLDVAFTANGVEITGEELEPEIVEGAATTPYPSFVFNNVEFKTSNDYYTECELTFKVAGVYEGSFSGSYLNSYYIK